jgi:HK97 family phage prohead protease
MDTKNLRVEVKDADKGQVSAVFSTNDVIDSDGDVTVKGAFTDGAPVRISAYQHMSWSGALPVGKGVLRVSGKETQLDGQFFLQTTAGRDTFEVVKQMGDLQEWSYGYDVVDAEFGEHDGKNVRFLKALKVHEVSPVLIGAGVGTRTLAAKSGGRTFSDEATLVMASVNALVDRAADVMAMRQEKGKALGTDSSVLLDQLEGQLKRLSGLLVAAEATPDHTEEELQREYLRFLQSASRVA